MYCEFSLDRVKIARGGGGGGHSQTNVLPTRVQTPQKWTLNGVLRHIKFAPLNGVTPVKHNLKYASHTLHGVLCYGTQYNTLNGVLCYGTHYTIP